MWSGRSYVQLTGALNLFSYSHCSGEIIVGNLLVILRLLLQFRSYKMVLEYRVGLDCPRILTFLNAENKLNTPAHLSTLSEANLKYAALLISSVFMVIFQNKIEMDTW